MRRWHYKNRKIKEVKVLGVIVLATIMTSIKTKLLSYYEMKRTQD